MQIEDSYQINVDHRELRDKKHYSVLRTRTTDDVHLHMSEFQLMKYVRTLGMDLSFIDIHPSSVGNVNKFSKLISEL